jgi:hypothetical protein
MPNRYQVFFLLTFASGLGALFTLSHFVQQALGKRGYSPIDLLLTGLPRNTSANDTTPSAFIDPIAALINMANESGFDINAFVAQNQTALAGAFGAVALTAAYFLFGQQKPKSEDRALDSKLSPLTVLGRSCIRP